MDFFTTRKIFPWLYSLKDPNNVFCYLLIGEEKALLFDTAYGIGDLPEAVRKITDKPLTVVLSHAHVDHACGAYQFNEVFMHEADFSVCEIHTCEEYRREAVKEMASNGIPLPDSFDRDAYYKAGTGNLKKLEIGRVFDLGGLNPEVIQMEGHTPGSIGLLVREFKVLLDGDAANSHIWMFLPESLPISEYIAMLERTMLLDFDKFIVGHSDEPLPKSDMLNYLSAARNANMEKAKPYRIFPQFGGYLYQESSAGIVFNESKLG